MFFHKQIYFCKSLDIQPNFKLIRITWERGRYIFLAFFFNQAWLNKLLFGQPSLALGPPLSPLNVHLTEQASCTRSDFDIPPLDSKSESIIWKSRPKEAASRARQDGEWRTRQVTFTREDKSARGQHALRQQGRSRSGSTNNTSSSNNKN